MPPEETNPWWITSYWIFASSNLWPGIAGGEGCVVVVVVQLRPDELLDVFRFGVGWSKALPESGIFLREGFDCEFYLYASVATFTAILMLISLTLVRWGYNLEYFKSLSNYVLAFQLAFNDIEQAWRFTFQQQYPLPQQGRQDPRQRRERLRRRCGGSPHRSPPDWEKVKFQHGQWWLKNHFSNLAPGKM